MSTLNTCTSSTRPSSPSTGDMLFETDTNKCVIYDGAAWRVADPTFSLEPQIGDWKVIKDSYGSDTYSVDYNGASHGTGAPGFNERRIDPDGTAYYSTSGAWPSISGTAQNTGSEYNLSSLQSSNSGLYTARAIRFKCKRPNPGAGYFSIWRFGILKGASGHGGAFRNMTPAGRDSIHSYMRDQGEAEKTWGFNAMGNNAQSSIAPVHGETFGTSLFPSGKNVWVCPDSNTSCWFTADINDPQDRGISFFKETDPTSEGVASKTNNSTWIRTQINSVLTLGDSNHSERSFGDVINGIFAPHHSNYRPTFGIKGGAGWSAEVYFTFFFASSINITNLEGITYNALSDQAGSEVSIEFLMT